MDGLDIEKRVELSLAVGRYLRASERFNEAVKEFTEKCKSLRKQLGSNKRYVIQVDYEYYIISSDAEGNLDVEPIQSI